MHSTDIMDLPEFSECGANGTQHETKIKYITNDIPLVRIKYIHNIQRIAYGCAFVMDLPLLVAVRVTGKAVTASIVGLTTKRM